jgi:hypothetical protein
MFARALVAAALSTLVGAAAARPGLLDRHPAQSAPGLSAGGSHVHAAHAAAPPIAAARFAAPAFSPPTFVVAGSPTRAQPGCGSPFLLEDRPLLL